MLSTTSSLCPKNESQRSINDLGPATLENHGALPLQRFIIIPSAAFLRKYAYHKIVTMVQKRYQRSANNFCTGILDNLIRMECRLTTMNLSAACIATNTRDDIASACYNWAPKVCQGSERYTAINCIMPFQHGVLRSQSLQSVLEFNFTNVHAKSYWSDYFHCSCRVNI
jgi:hypothetical protein